jgi:hypothetical protein
VQKCKDLKGVPARPYIPFVEMVFRIDEGFKKFHSLLCSFPDMPIADIRYPLFFS